MKNRYDFFMNIKKAVNGVSAFVTVGYELRDGPEFPYISDEMVRTVHELNQLVPYVFRDFRYQKHTESQVPVNQFITYLQAVWGEHLAIRVVPDIDLKERFFFDLSYILPEDNRGQSEPLSHWYWVIDYMDYVLRINRGYAPSHLESDRPSLGKWYIPQECTFTADQHFAMLTLIWEIDAHVEFVKHKIFYNDRTSYYGVAASNYDMKNAKMLNLQMWMVYWQALLTWNESLSVDVAINNKTVQLNAIIPYDTKGFFRLPIAFKLEPICDFFIKKFFPAI